jgi:hypothetical protein|tara:strand:- start:469 stop:645 length:177 start_codon:yes stop_codon:yes gene_type:complete
MKEIGILIKKFINPPKSGNLWICVKPVMKTNKEKENFIFATIELLNNKIKVNGQDTEY